MKQAATSFTVGTRGKGLYEFTEEVEQWVAAQEMHTGLLTLFIRHTSASLTIQENADPDVVADMAMALDRMVPWAAGYAHDEGNAAAHVKASLMGSSVRVLVESGRLRLGTWQGIYFCEFDGPRTRTVWVG